MMAMNVRNNIKVLFWVVTQWLVPPYIFYHFSERVDFGWLTAYFFLIGAVSFLKNWFWNQQSSALKRILFLLLWLSVFVSLVQAVSRYPFY